MISHDELVPGSVYWVVMFGYWKPEPALCYSKDSMFYTLGSSDIRQDKDAEVIALAVPPSRPYKRETP